MFKINKNKGFTLTEILLVLGLAAIIIIIIFMTYPKVSSSVRARKEVSNITAIIAGVKNLYSSSSTYVGLSNNVLKNAGVFPDNTIVENSTYPTNTWGGILSVGPQTVSYNGNTYTNNAFGIIDTSIPAAECTKMITAISGFSDVISININAQVLKSSTVSFSISNLVNYCNAGGNSNIITLIIA